jgi:hypothetical protein
MLSIDPLSVVVRLSVDSMSDVRVRLLMAVHPHEDEQGVQSVELDISARSQGKTKKKFYSFFTKEFYNNVIMKVFSSNYLNKKVLNKGGSSEIQYVLLNVIMDNIFFN